MRLLLFASSVVSALACTSAATCRAAVAAAIPRLPAPLRPLLHAAATSLLAAPPALLGNTTDQKYCPDSGAFDLVPITVATLSPAGPSHIWGNDGCFRSLIATAVFNASGGVAVTLKGSNPTSLLCSDTYLLATSFSLTLPVEVSTLAPTATLRFASWAGADEAADVALHGVRVGLLPCGLLGSVASLLATVDIFSPLSGKEADLVASNQKFLNGRGIWTGPNKGPLVPFAGPQALPASSINSGDYFAILRFDGLDPMIGFGTGFGATGHSAVCVWRGAGAARQLWVLEATDRDPFGPAVFFGSGIIKTKYEDWIPLAQQAAYNVALLPLRPALATSFNEDALWAWFDSVEGTPYGYQNFLYAVLDTYPLMSLPLPLDEGMLVPILNAADAVLGPAPPGQVSTSLTVDTMLVQGLNKRLNLTCSTLACVVIATNANAAAGRSPASVLEATALPERDAWRYAGGNVSYVCSAFAAMAYKVGLAGLLPDFEATEQTPTDNVKAGMWDGAKFNAGNCGVGVWTPNNGNGTVCQLLGSTRMPLGKYSPFCFPNHASPHPLTFHAHNTQLFNHTAHTRQQMATIQFLCMRV